MNRWVWALGLLALVYAWHSCSDTRELNSLTVRPEYRCSSYDRSDYYYPQSVEPLIAERDGMVSRYTGYRFSTLRESQIEHVVALSEAHDSGDVRGFPGSAPTVRPGLGQLGSGPAEGQSKEIQQGCGRLGTRTESMLVRTNHHPGEGEVQPQHRCPRKSRTPQTAG